MPRRKYTVYSHRNLINGKVYVGMTSLAPYARWRSDGSGYKQQSRFWHDICEYGWENFEHVIHASGIPQGKAKQMERSLIKELHTQDPQRGYNVLPGGDIGATDAVGSFKNVFGSRHPASVQVYCPELDETFGSISDAALFADVTPAAISLCLRGKSKTSGCHYQTGARLHWEYVERKEDHIDCDKRKGKTGHSGELPGSPLPADCQAEERPASVLHGRE